MPNLWNEPKKLQAWFDRVKGDRSQTESTWQEIADEEFGIREFKTKRTPGLDRTQEIYDTTAMFAHQLLAGGLHGLLTNPAAMWFDLVPTKRQLRNDTDVRFWLDDARMRMLAVSSTAGSGFTTNMAEVYLDIPGFGMGNLWIEGDAKFGCKFSAKPLNQQYCEANDKGDIDIIFSEVPLTARQFQQKYPNHEIGVVREALEKENGETMFTAMRLIAPSDDPMAGKSPFRKPWTSVTWVMDGQQPSMVERAGYFENPMLTPRWSVESGEVYGRGPGWTALANAKMLNVMQKTIIKAGQKAADPPLLVTDETVVDGIRTTPGGVNIVQDRPGVGGQPEPIRPLDNRARVDIGIELIERHGQAVKNAFWSQILQMFEDPRMTATQVLQLATQAQRLMAPMLGRIQQELLEPLLNRQFSIMLRNGWFLPAPAVLAGENIEISYVSPITRAQRQSEADSIMRAWQGAAMISQAAQSADPLDILDPDESVRIIAEASAVPGKVIRDIHAVQSARDARTQQAQQQQLMQQADQGSQIVERLAGAAGEVQGLAEAA